MTKRGASLALRNLWFRAGLELRNSGRTGNKQHTHVNILTLLTRASIRQKLWSLRLSRSWDASTKRQ